MKPRHRSDDVAQAIVEVLERFMSFVSPEPNTGCWLWTGNVIKSGQPHFWFKGRSVKAYRFLWEAIRGPIPPGKMLLHSCIGMRCCVNLAHLRPGTHQENMADRRQQGRAAFGMRNARYTHPESTARGERNGGGGKLTAGAVELMRELHRVGMPAEQVAILFGVSRSMVGQVVRRKVWRHVA